MGNKKWKKKQGEEDRGKKHKKQSNNIATKKRINVKNEKQKKKIQYDSEISNSEDYVII